MAASSARCEALPLALEIAPTLRYLKNAAVSSPSTALHVPGGGSDQRDTQIQVTKILNDIEQGGEKTVLELARKFDGWEKTSVEVAASDIDNAIRSLSESEKQDITFQYAQVRAFALSQRASVKEFQNELHPGVTTGQKVVPIQCAGCYIPGGRFSHVSSAIMSVATAKAAGVKTVIVCSPPLGNTGMIHPATLYALHIAGADRILCLGGIQAVATLAFGLFTGVEADILVGPGNKWVAEAKRNLFGRVGIDMVAGPTEILILADESADALLVATDLLSQAEHGVTSPAWLITTCAALGTQVIAIMEDLLDDLQRRQPDTASRTSWHDYGEVILVDTRDEMARLSDLYAAEHLEVHCRDLDWYLHTGLHNYGSVFLGEETCVTYGDKCSGPNHILPTKRVARYTGGLSVDKFQKKLTWQRMTREANATLGAAAARISRLEGMEGHAMAGDARLVKYFPGEVFDLGSSTENVDRMRAMRSKFNSKL